MIVKVFYHDKCFDGACSASLFTRFYRERIRKHAEFQYQGLLHRAGALFDLGDFTGDENAIVDFKYSTDPHLTWWFDHHQSAFLTPEDAAHYRWDTSGKKMFDPSFKSCTLYIATVARERFGFEANDLDELVRWADIIDGAQYGSAEEAVALGDPAMRLTLVIEGSTGPDTVQYIIRQMRHESLGAIAADPRIQAVYQPLYGSASEIHRYYPPAGALRRRRGVVRSDRLRPGRLQQIHSLLLTSGVLYSVGLSKSSFRMKISVGSNPWTGAENMINLAKICERYGGGGHARVGAISFPPGEFHRASQAAQEIVTELRAHAARYHAKQTSPDAAAND